MENLHMGCWFTSKILQNGAIQKCPQCRRWFKEALCSCGFRQEEIRGGKGGTKREAIRDGHRNYRNH